MKVIDKELYERLKTMINSNNQSNIDMVVTIIDNCNIKKSFFYILLLIAETEEVDEELGTKLSKSKNLREYISKINEYKKDKPLRRKIVSIDFNLSLNLLINYFLLEYQKSIPLNIQQMFADLYPHKRKRSIFNRFNDELNLKPKKL